MRRGVYVGSDKTLLGETALLQFTMEIDENGSEVYWSAQFDNADKVDRELTHGWHRFEYDDFDIIPDDIDMGCDKCLPLIEKLMQWYLGFWFVGLAVVGFAILKACALAS